MKKIIKYTFIALVSIYLLINIFLFFLQKDLLYFPDKTNFYSCKNFSQDEMKTYKNTRFYGVKWEKNNVIVFFHWNAWRACDRKHILENLKKTWNSIIFVEYDGYADNKSPNIQKILKNVEEIWEYVSNRNFDKVFVMWRSLWTWPASYFAWKYRTDKLLLISPYDELYKVAQEKYPIFPVKLLFTENFTSKDYLQNYTWNVLIVHWKSDRVIPYNHWLDLYNSLNTKNKNIILLENIGHSNIFTQKVNEKIVEYFKN